MKDIVRVRNPSRLKALIAGVLSVMVFAAPSQLEGGVMADPDVATSSERYRARFRTATGKWFLQRQADTLLRMLASWPGARVLDVGGGHGQYTLLLAEQGYTVTVLGSSAEADGQIRDLIAEGRCTYQVGSLANLPFPDRSFDVVISFRLLAHLDDWRRFVRESARVASKAVVVDLPVVKSVNALYRELFWLKRIAESKSTRPFRIFREQDVIDAFEEAGLSLTSRTAQFLLPMAFHRVLHACALSRATERVCQTLGLTPAFGSPVVLCLEPHPPARAG